LTAKRVGVIALVGAAVAAYLVLRPARPPDLVTDFHAVERHALTTFNDALARQRANQLDELGLADVVERDVLPPWSALHARVAATPQTDANRELLAAMTRYLTDRETAWRAFSIALRSPGDTTARYQYGAYHQADAAANADAQALARLLPK
jgi:hypothetical protein